MLVMNYIMFSGVTDSLYTVHFQYTLWCYCPSIVGIVYIPSLAKSYEMTLRKQEKSRKVTLVGQVISEILKPLKMVLYSFRETVSLKKFYKLAGPPVFYSGLNESSLAPQFKWLDNTFK
jgi:hypothetical protein